MSIFYHIFKYLLYVSQLPIYLLSLAIWHHSVLSIDFIFPLVDIY